jgi:hypothetical protein
VTAVVLAPKESFLGGAAGRLTSSAESAKSDALEADVSVFAAEVSVEFACSCCSGFFFYRWFFPL